jgi:hypothetical protein
MPHTTKVYLQNGGDAVVVDAGGTATWSGAITGAASITATTTLVAGTSLHVGTTALIDGKLTATGGVESTAAFTVNTDKFVVNATTGVVTMKNGTTIDNNAAADTVTITETKIGLTGNTTVTGTLAVTGILSCGTAKFSVAPATGILTLGNSMVIDGNTGTDQIQIGALIAICNDNSPAGTVPAGGVTAYFDGTNLKLRNAAGGTFTFTGSWA